MTNPPRKNKTRDWQALKREWLKSRETLNEFRLRHGISNDADFYRRVKAGRWREERELIEAEATRIIVAKATAGRVEEWEQQLSLLTSIEKQIAVILKKHVNAEGEIVSTIDPFELKALAEVVSKSVNVRKNIKGEKGPDDNAGGPTINLHQVLVKVVNEIENDGDGPTLLDPPALGHKRGG